MMPASSKYPDELKQRAVRLVLEDDERGATARVADQLGINRETLRKWVKAARRERDEPETVNLEAENAGLCGRLFEAERANEILKAASNVGMGEDISIHDLAVLIAESSGGMVNSCSPPTYPTGRPGSCWTSAI